MDYKLQGKIFSCFAAALFSFYNLFLLSLLNVISLDLITAFHLTISKLGLLSSCDLWANAIGFIPIGILLDRYSVRRIGLYMLSLAIVATFIMSFSQSYLLTCSSRFLQGLASATSLLITMRLGSTIFTNNSNIVVGIMITIALSGGIIGNSIFAHIVAVLGWRQALLAAAGLGLVCLYLMRRFLLVTPLTQYSSKSTLQPSTIFQAFNVQNVLAGIYLGFINTPIFILGTLWGNYYLVHAMHLPMMTAANFSTLLFLGIILGSPCWGFIADKWVGVRNVTYFSCVFLLSLSILLLNGTLATHTVAIVFLCLGLFSCTQNLVYPYITKNNPMTVVSTVIGVASIISNSLGAGMQELFGFLMQTQRISDHSAIIILPLSFLICLILAVYLNGFHSKHAILKTDHTLLSESSS